MHGWWGQRVFEVDASGAIVRELEVDPITGEQLHIDPVAGFDIQLSIDLDVQQYAEQALETELRSGATCRSPTGRIPDRGIAPHATRSTGPPSSRPGSTSGPFRTGPKRTIRST